MQSKTQDRGCHNALMCDLSDVAGDDSSTAALCKSNQPASTMHSCENCGGNKQKPLVPYDKSNGEHYCFHLTKLKRIKRFLF